MILFSLLLLAFIPLCSFLFASKRYPKRIALITGISLGSIISPLSMGLYATFFIPIVGFIPGMIGLVSVTFHYAPGYDMATWLGLRVAGTVVSFSESIPIEIINGVFWGTVYGILGLGIDYLIDKH